MTGNLSYFQPVALHAPGSDVRPLLMKMSFAGLGFAASLLAACASPASDATADNAAADTTTTPAITAALNEPIERFQMAGVDLRINHTYAQLEVEWGAASVSDSGGIGWGDVDGFSGRHRLEAEADPARGGAITALTGDLGYSGTFEFRSRNSPQPYGSHHYSIATGRRIMRDNDMIDGPLTDAVANELYDGIIATFPANDPLTATDCFSTQKCSLYQSTLTDPPTYHFAMDGFAFDALPNGIVFAITVLPMASF